MSMCGATEGEIRRVVVFPGALFESIAERRLRVSYVPDPLDAGTRLVITGHDVSGVVEEVGPGVTAFAPGDEVWYCLLYTSPSPRDGLLSRMPSSA